jgi:hypothetical protein
VIDKPFKSKMECSKMMKKCPNCQSERIVTKDVAKKTCGFLGMVGGVASATTSTLSGAELGGTVGMPTGPAGAMLGAIAGALLGALVGGTTGGVAGAKLGEVIDDKILDNHQCLACDYVFSQKTD